MAVPEPGDELRFLSSEALIISIGRNKTSALVCMYLIWEVVLMKFYYLIYQKVEWLSMTPVRQNTREPL